MEWEGRNDVAFSELYLHIYHRYFLDISMYEFVMLRLGIYLCTF